MLTKAEIQYLRSLHHKEGRTEAGMFLAEGNKIVAELISDAVQPEMIISTEEWCKENRLSEKTKQKLKIASRSEIERCSSLKTPQDVIAVCKIPHQSSVSEVNSTLVIALDDVQDPGNVGTIIRTAAWFRMGYVLCSNSCADLYNSKVIQASMGAFYRVKVIYGELPVMLTELRKMKYSIAATLIDGDSIDLFSPKGRTVLVMGNESRGVSLQISNMADFRLSIPSYSSSGNGIESLNVSSAASIACFELSKKNKDGNLR